MSGRGGTRGRGRGNPREANTKARGRGQDRGRGRGHGSSSGGNRFSNKDASNLRSRFEQIEVCPYDESHRLRPERLQYHLNMCRRSLLKDPEHPLYNKAKEFDVCPFNAKHHIPLSQYEEHQKSCPTREEIYEVYSTDPIPAWRNAVIKSIGNLIESTENWDDEEGDDYRDKFQTTGYQTGYGHTSHNYSPSQSDQQKSSGYFYPAPDDFLEHTYDYDHVATDYSYATSDYPRGATGYPQSHSDYSINPDNYVKSQTDCQPSVEYLKSSASYLVSQSDYLQSQNDYIQPPVSYLKSDSNAMRSSPDYAEFTMDHYLQSPTAFQKEPASDNIEGELASLSLR